MITRSLLAAIAGLTLVAASEPPPVPEILTPYLDEEAVFDPGDYGWMRGAFDDASEQEQTGYAVYLDWRRECHEDALTELRISLAERGYPDATLFGVGSAPLLCRMAGFVPALEGFSSFSSFQEELQKVQPIYQSYLLAMHQADEFNWTRSEDIGKLLERSTMGEQVLRSGLNWGQGNMSDAPEVTPVGRAILRSALWVEIAWHDDDNTTWLKKIVAEHGWPKKSEVGPDAANKAWLLVQHADADPLFQLDALRLMEPLLADEEVSQKNFAYLYDRVMLKLAGKQRYGTQAHCQEGEYAAQPLEDEAMVDDYRSRAELEPLEEYLARLLANYGPCTPPPPSAE